MTCYSQPASGDEFAGASVPVEFTHGRTLVTITPTFDAG
jgi:hypothetical protein